jgi:hypothetical protein
MRSTKKENDIITMLIPNEGQLFSCPLFLLMSETVFNTRCTYLYSLFKKMLMNKHLLPLLLAPLLLLFISCGSNEALPATDIDAAKQFVDNIWQNDFTKAEKLILNDEGNKQTFDGFRAYYNRLPKEELQKYKNATLVLNSVTPLNDSISIVNFSADFNKIKKDELKIVRTNGQWYIDLKPEVK